MFQLICCHVKVKVKNNHQCLYSHALLRTHSIEGQREGVEACCVLCAEYSYGQLGSFTEVDLPLAHWVHPKTTNV